MIKFNIKHKIIENQKDGFDIRIVPYEEIHNILQKDFNKLVEVINPQKNDKILDAGAGYGAVTREILYKFINENLNIYLLDISPVQLKRAVKELNIIFKENLNKNKLCFVHDSLVHPLCIDNIFDKIICKMVIHEIPKKLQQEALNETFRIIKPGGKLIIWDLFLDDETQTFFQKVMKKKDELAGYNFLAKNRYFLREDEWIEMIKNAGYINIKKESNVFYELNTKIRLKYEFNNDLKKLIEWNESIRDEAKLLPKKVLTKLNYKDNKDDIMFVPHKSIYSAIKE